MGTVGFLKSLFGGKSKTIEDELAYLDHVDPQTGFTHSWSDEERHDFCMKALESLKGHLGGELRKTEDEMRLYSEGDGRKVVIGATWFTGDLVVSVNGANRLGPLGILRDEALDEEGEFDEAEKAEPEEVHAKGWTADTDFVGEVKEYVAEGIYLEDSKEDLVHEQKRLATIPEALRAKIFDAMHNDRLQTVFTTEEGLDFTWYQWFFRVGSPAPALPSLVDLALRVTDVFENNLDPDPASPNAVARCPFCDLKIVDSTHTKCANCGGVL